MIKIIEHFQAFKEASLLARLMLHPGRYQSIAALVCGSKWSGHNRKRILTCEFPPSTNRREAPVRRGTPRDTYSYWIINMRLIYLYYINLTTTIDFSKGSTNYLATSALRRIELNIPYCSR